MKHPGLAKVVIISFGVVLLLPLNHLPAFENNQDASIVIGQPDMFSNSPNRGGSLPDENTLWWPGGLQVSGGKLFVADYLNNRVLIYDPVPSWNNATAQVVIGQVYMVKNGPNQDSNGVDPDVPYANTLHQPDDVQVFGGQLMIADAENNRSLVFDTVPTWNNATAQVVIGQPGMESFKYPNQKSEGIPSDSNTLKNPRRLCISGGKVFLADRENNRVLIYDSIPTFNNSTASVVVGQVNFGSSAANQGMEIPTATTLNKPTGVFVTGNKLFITDTGNNRILIFNQIPTSNNAAADVALGQYDFFHNQPNRDQATPLANTLYNPFGSVFSDGTRLFVTDNDNHRVLIFNSIPTDMLGAAYRADIVLGQQNMFSNFINKVDSDPPHTPTAQTMYWPDGLYLDVHTLYVSDTHNNRVLVFEEPIPSPTPFGYKTPSPSPTVTQTPYPPPHPDLDRHSYRNPEPDDHTIADSGEF